jgi:hypothetical protein
MASTKLVIFGGDDQVLFSGVSQSGIFRADTITAELPAPPEVERAPSERPTSMPPAPEATIERAISAPPAEAVERPTAAPPAEDEVDDTAPTMIPPPPASGMFPLKLVVAPNGFRAGLPVMGDVEDDDWPTALYDIAMLKR